MAYGNIGNALDSLGQFNEAIEYHKKDLEIAQQTGKRRPIRSQHYFSVEILVFAGDKWGEGAANANIGNALQSLGQVNEAIEHHKKFLEVAQQTGLKRPIRSQHFLIR